MSALKALILGAILTFVVSGAIRAGGSSGGYLHIEQIQLSGQFIPWSWPLFIVMSGVIWGILLLMK